VKGGETLTLTGTNFVSTTSDITVTIDGIDCAVTSASSTQIQCTTGARPGIVEDTTLEIYIDGYGSVSTQSIVFRYVSLWSDEDTWGGLYAPVEGESIYI
jgi:hypothetical protein